MSKASQNEILLNALVDGQLSDGEREDALRLISANPKYADYVNELKAQRERFSGLPSFSLAGDFASRVLKESALLASNSTGLESSVNDVPINNAASNSKAVNNALNDNALNDIALNSIAPAGKSTKSAPNSVGHSSSSGVRRANFAAITAISSLAAMLLVTLTLIPMIQNAGLMVGDSAGPTSQAPAGAAETADSDLDEAMAFKGGFDEESIEKDDANSEASANEIAERRADDSPAESLNESPTREMVAGNSPGSGVAADQPRLEKGGVPADSDDDSLDHLSHLMMRSGNGPQAPRPDANSDLDNAVAESPAVESEEIEAETAAPDAESLIVQHTKSAPGAMQMPGGGGFGAGQQSFQISEPDGQAGYQGFPELMVVELASRDQLASVENVLLQNRIDVGQIGSYAQNVNPGQEQFLNVSGQTNVEAVYVLATPKQMRNAITMLTNVEVATFQVPDLNSQHALRQMVVQADPYAGQQPNNSLEGGAGMNNVGGLRGNGNPANEGYRDENAGAGAGGGLINPPIAQNETSPTPTGSDPSFDMQQFVQQPQQHSYAVQMQRNVDVPRGSDQRFRSQEADKLNRGQQFADTNLPPALSDSPNELALQDSVQAADPSMTEEHQRWLRDQQDRELASRQQQQSSEQQTLETESQSAGMGSGGGQSQISDHADLQTGPTAAQQEKYDDSLDNRLQSFCLVFHFTDDQTLPVAPADAAPMNESDQ